MAQSLPVAANDNAESDAAISRFCEHLEFFVGHPPLAVRVLASGESNINYYIRTVRGEFVLRRYPLVTIGVCRQQELRCQHAAAAAGLAPAPLSLNNHQQLLISEFIADGQKLHLTAERLPHLAQVIAKLHNLTVQTPILQVSQYLRQLIDNSQLAALEPTATLFSALKINAELLQQIASDRVLCHMDLHQGNLLLAAERIWLLDFEYAQLADSSFDLAAICLHFQLNSEQERQLLRHYMANRCFVDKHSERQHQQTLLQRLALAKILYSGFCWLWYQATPAAQRNGLQWRFTLTRLLALQAT